ncbi:MAG: hypothetical protein R3F42_07320 [Pseudomonadota bacterium]
MANVMGVLLNGIAQLEYDRDRLLPEQQLAYLDRMDARMDAGIPIGDETVTNPDIGQRAHFAAANLVRALQTDDESLAAAMCSYLAIRLPDLKQVRIEDSAGEVSIELVFDEAYRRQVAVDLKPLH